MQRFSLWVSALAATLIVAGCGGSGGEAGGNKLGFTSIASFGDSLSDAGTHAVGSIAAIGGGRYTVNSGNPAVPTKIWLDHLSAQLGLPAPCAAVTGLNPLNPFALIPGGGAAAVTNRAGCTNHAQGGSRITNPVGPGHPLTAPQSSSVVGQLTYPLTRQVSEYLSRNGGSFSNKTLVTVLAGGNDIFMNGGLVQASVITPTTAVLNMATAGTELANLIKNEIVGKGAKHVLVLNLPDVSSSPNGLEAGTEGAAFTNQMVQAFNNALSAGLAGVPGIAFGDAYSTSRDQFSNAAAYGLSNTKNRACSTTYSPLTNPLSGAAIGCNVGNVISGDVSRYLFADDVHPTAYGHQLLAQYAAKVMATAGWL
jgi:outer membrane lipase/esterase